MSRLMVKNLPKNMKETRLRSIFERHGEITQVRLLGKRRFAYIGFLTEGQAKAAMKQLHDSYIDTSKIEVSTAMKYGDDRLPRPWSKYSAGSSGYASRMDSTESGEGGTSLVGAEQSGTKGESVVRRERLAKVSETVAKEQQLLEDL